MVRRRFTSAALFAAVLCAPAFAIAQAARSGPTFNLGGTTVPVENPDVAFDSVNNQYLQVAGKGFIEAHLLNAAGSVLRTFNVTNSGLYAQGPRVAFSPHIPGGGGYIVTWHASIGDIARVRARIFNKNGDTLTGEFDVATSATSVLLSTQWTMGAPVVASTGATKEFLVVWAGNKFTTYDIFAQRVSLSGELLGGNVLISTGSADHYDRDPSVDYNPWNDKYLIGWGIYYESGRFGQSAARTFAASNGALGPTRTYGTAVGVTFTSVAYNPTANQFLFSWFHQRSNGQSHYGMVLDAEGVPASETKVVSPYYSAYDALDVKFNVLAGQYLLVTHGFNHEDAAVSINSAGNAYDNGFLVTSTTGVNGNFNPRLTTSTFEKKWLIVTSSNFARTVAQFVTSDASGGGTPPPPPPPPGPPPPPAPCTYSISPASVSLGHGAADGTMIVTTQSGCAWSASNNEVVTFQNGTGRSGTGSLPFSIAANPGSSRSTTTLVAGQTFTVAQAGAPVACSYSISPASITIGGAAASGTVSVTAPNGCSWAANGVSGFVSFQDGRGRSGSGSVSFNVTANPSTLYRSWSATIAGQPFTVTQAGSAFDQGARRRENGRADFNSDGRSDLLTQDLSSGILRAWLLNAHNVTDQQALSNHIGDNNWRIAGTGDFDADGHADIVWQHLTEGWLYIWFMNGTTRVNHSYFSIQRLADAQWRLKGVGDFDGNGTPDLIWQHPNGTLAAWLMIGATVHNRVSLSPGGVLDTRWQIQGVGDFNGDGQSDLVWRHTRSGEVGVWLMNGLSRMEFVSLNPGVVANQDWQISSVIDANGDNSPDLIWHNATDGTTAVWYMAGTIRIGNPSLTAMVPLGTTMSGPK